MGRCGKIIQGKQPKKENPLDHLFRELKEPGGMSRQGMTPGSFNSRNGMGIQGAVLLGASGQGPTRPREGRRRPFKDEIPQICLFTGIVKLAIVICGTNP